MKRNDKPMSAPQYRLLARVLRHGAGPYLCSGHEERSAVVLQRLGLVWLERSSNWTWIRRGVGPTSYQQRVMITQFLLTPRES